MFYLVWVVLVGILAGWLAGQITKGRGFGIFGDLIVGILGSQNCRRWNGRNPAQRSSLNFGPTFSNLINPTPPGSSWRLVGTVTPNKSVYWTCLISGTEIRLPGTYPDDAQLNYFRIADHPEVGQGSQYKRVCRYKSDRRTVSFRLARNPDTMGSATGRLRAAMKEIYANRAPGSLR